MNKPLKIRGVYIDKGKDGNKAYISSSSSSTKYSPC